MPSWSSGAGCTCGRSPCGQSWVGTGGSRSRGGGGGTGWPSGEEGGMPEGARGQRGELRKTGRV